MVMFGRDGWRRSRASSLVIVAVLIRGRRRKRRAQNSNMSRQWSIKNIVN